MSLAHRIRTGRRTRPGRKADLTTATETGRTLLGVTLRTPVTRRLTTHTTARPTGHRPLPAPSGPVLTERGAVVDSVPRPLTGAVATRRSPTAVRIRGVEARPVSGRTATTAVADAAVPAPIPVALAVLVTLAFPTVFNGRRHGRRCPSPTLVTPPGTGTRPGRLGQQLLRLGQYATGLGQHPTNVRQRTRPHVGQLTRPHVAHGPSRPIDNAPRGTRDSLHHRPRTGLGGGLAHVAHVGHVGHVSRVGHVGLGRVRRPGGTRRTGHSPHHRPHRIRRRRPAVRRPRPLPAHEADDDKAREQHEHPQRTPPGGRAHEARHHTRLNGCGNHGGTTFRTEQRRGRRG